LTTWDKIYKNYQKGGPAVQSLSVPVYPAFKKFVESTDFPVKKVLDIGCGDGRYLIYLQRLGYKTDGIDSSPTAVKMTKRILKKNSRVEKADMFKYRIPADKYDFIFSVNTLQHGRKGAINKVVNRIYAALKNRGKTWITLPDYRQLLKWRTFKEKKKISPGTYLPLIGPEKGLYHSFFRKAEVKKIFSKFNKVKMKLGERGRWFIQAEK
jgi:SAM-dependent methyltransferase